MSYPVLAVHGGAGRLERGRLRADDERALRRGLTAALVAGHALLAAGASALDAVERAVAELEDDPAFNAGTGSVLTAAGTVEMDAAVMDGRRRGAGAVACVSRVAHPVALARQVLERTPHVLLVGAGAEAFAAELGWPAVDPSSRVTPARRAQLERMRARARIALDHDAATSGEDPGATGTVGAVARDGGGHLAAATSTGGMTLQRPGRVGDSPVPGAGTWADDRGCAVSATGDGEAFLRCAFAHEVDARVRLAGQSPEAACRAALEEVAGIGAAGGALVLARSGPPFLGFTTAGMLRGVIGPDTAPRVAVFGDEVLSPP